MKGTHRLRTKGSRFGAGSTDVASPLMEDRLILAIVTLWIVCSVLCNKRVRKRIKKMMKIACRILFLFAGLVLLLGR